MSNKKVPTRKNDKAVNKEIEVKQEDGTVEKKRLGRRTPLHEQKKLGIKERPGWVRRCVNEKLGRIEAFLEAGWTPVNEEDQNIANKRVQDPKDLGSVYRPLVNPSGYLSNTHAIWMEIPEEYYNEDQTSKIRKLQNKEDQINPSKDNDPNYYYTKFNKTYE